MRILIDARMLFWPGVGRYTKALLDNLARLDTKNEYIVVTRTADRALWEPTERNFTRMEVDIDPYSLGEQTKLGRIIRNAKPDLVHFTAANAPAFYSGARIVTLHDLTLLDYDTSRGQGVGRLVKKMKRLPFRFVLWRSVVASRKLLTPTQYVKDQLIQRFGISSSKIRVTLLAADKNLAPPASLDRFPLSPKFLLFVGSVFPYKNADLIVDALKLMQSTQPELKLAFTCPPDYFREQLENKVGELRLQDKVVFTGYVTDGELVSLYRSATAYIHPSLSEGFGLQGLEAMSQGLPVLAARASCMEEICGNAALYFDPYNASELAEKISELISNPEMQESMQQLGYTRAKQFSWKKMAEETLAEYRSA